VFKSQTCCSNDLAGNKPNQFFSSTRLFGSEKFVQFVGEKWIKTQRSAAAGRLIVGIRWGGANLHLEN
jgi:hypothetical protein